MKYCCEGGRPLTGCDNSDTMKEECIGHKLTSIYSGSWGHKSFSRFSFDNGYIVEIEDRVGRDAIYDNQTIMEFELYAVKREDGRNYYFIIEDNANKYYDIQLFKQKTLHKENDFYSFHLPPKKVKLRKTSYQLKDMYIIDQDYANAGKISWLDYIENVRKNQEDNQLEDYYDEDDD